MRARRGKRREDRGRARRAGGEGIVRSEGVGWRRAGRRGGNLEEGQKFGGGSL